MSSSNNSITCWQAVYKSITRKSTSESSFHPTNSRSSSLLIIKNYPSQNHPLIKYSDHSLIYRIKFLNCSLTKSQKLSLRVIILSRTSSNLNLCSRISYVSKLTRIGIILRISRMRRLSIRIHMAVIRIRACTWVRTTNSSSALLGANTTRSSRKLARVISGSWVGGFRLVLSSFDFLLFGYFNSI